jgi:hypothetical protein
MNHLHKGKNHPMFGKDHTEETKEKIKNKMWRALRALFGIKLSEKTKELISINSSKGLVELLDINKNLLHTFNPASATADHLEVHKMRISRYRK